MIHETHDGVEFDVRVIPRAHTTQTAGERSGAIVIRVAAPPVDDAANQALLRFLAKSLAVSERRIQLVKGDRSRNKRVRIEGIGEAQVRAVLLNPRG